MRGVAGVSRARRDEGICPTPRNRARKRVKDAIKDLNSDANELIKDAEKLEQQIKELEK